MTGNDLNSLRVVESNRQLPDQPSRWNKLVCDNFGNSISRRAGRECGFEWTGVLSSAIRPPLAIANV
jgi:hypothetical protein